MSEEKLSDFVNCNFSDLSSNLQRLRWV